MRIETLILKSLKVSDAGNRNFQSLEKFIIWEIMISVDIAANHRTNSSNRLTDFSKVQNNIYHKSS